MTDIEQRPRFYEGQYLEAADLTAAVDYSRTQLSRAMLAAHRWGIALGLDLTEVDGPNSTVDVFIQPGYAWDGFGRPILVPEPSKLSPALFALFDAAFTPANPTPPPVLVDVWLNYAETLMQGPRPGFETCDTADAFARVQESFRVEVGPRAALSSQRDPLEIAGRLTDAAAALSTFDTTAAPVVDADVPQQTLPVADTSRWLVPLGVVSWQPGNPGRLVKRDAAGLDRSVRTRQYCGVVAGSIEANGGHVTVHERSAAYPAEYTDDLLWVAGTTRADEDIRLYGSKLGLVATHSEVPIKPFQVARTDAASGEIALRLVIGDKSDGDNRLVIGPESAPGVYNDNVVVTDAGKVGIGTTTPIAPLHVVADGIEIGTDTPATKNFYLQVNDDASAPQVRGLRIYNKDVGAGTHIATFAESGQVGIGTTAPASPLHVTSALGIQQGSLYLNGDDRWSSLTFNAHHDAGNTTWVFPKPTKPAVTLEMDAVDGTPRFEVWTTPLGVNTTWLSRLKVDGHSGDVLMGMSGGNLGIGTITPRARVDVVGDIQASGNVQMGSLFAVGADQAVRVIWGLVEDSGSRFAGTGFTIAKISTGRYMITFDVVFSAQPTLMATRIYGDQWTNAGVAVKAGQTAVVDLVMANQALVATADETGALADGGFTFVAIGPR